MKKKLLAMLCCLTLAAASLTGCGGGSADTGAATTETGEGETQAPAASGGNVKIALITMDSIDQHWVTLNEGAQAAAAELGVTVDFMAPNTKDDAQQIECVNNAVAGGYNAIIVAANGPDAISSALKEASSAGVKIVYVDSPANVDAEATFSTDNKAAGKTAGEEMKKALEAAGTTSGDIGIVNVNAATDSCVMREEGFFKGADLTHRVFIWKMMETLLDKGMAVVILTINLADSMSLADRLIRVGKEGIVQEVNREEFGSVSINAPWLNLYR